MMRRIFAIGLAFCLLLGTAALAEAPTGYAFPDDAAVIHQLYILPGGDILCAGSFGRQAEDESYGETLSRLTKDGTEAWSYTVSAPYGDIGGSGPAKLSDDRYVMSTPVSDTEIRDYYFDAEKGLVEEIIRPMPEQQRFAIEDGMIAIDQTAIADGLRMQWLDLNGEAVQHKDYKFDHPQELYFQFLETGDSFYLLAQRYWDAENPGSTLTKLTKDGLVQWQHQDEGHYPDMHMLYPDGEGGILLVGGNGQLDATTLYPYTARRMSADGSTVWEKEIDLGDWTIRYHAEDENGIRMLWETEDSFKFVTMDREGALTDGPVYSKPQMESGSVQFSLGSFETDEGGQTWILYHTIEETDDYTTNVKPYLVPLDAFDPA